MITSKDNPQIKDLKKLQKKRFRLRQNAFAAEGEDLVAAALAADWVPNAVYCTPDAPQEFKGLVQAQEVDYDVLASASALGSGARVVAVFEHPEPEAPPTGGLRLVAHNIGDPGNVGTLIRSASAFTDAPVELRGACADPYSPKALRAAMGATFAYPPIEHPVEASATVIALDANGDSDLGNLAVNGPVELHVGGERDGFADLPVGAINARIPMRPDGPESLNVAMAATIALYELSKGIPGQPPN